MKTVTLSRQSAASVIPGNYRLDITITDANDITKALFVKQRIKRSDGSVDDVFVAVASPVQIEDIPLSEPTVGDLYFRDDTISLLASDPAVLQEASDQIFADIQLTLIQATDLDNLSTAETITIDPTNIVVS